MVSDSEDGVIIRGIDVHDRQLVDVWVRSLGEWRSLVSRVCVLRAEGFVIEQVLGVTSHTHLNCFSRSVFIGVAPCVSAFDWERGPA